MGLRAHRSMLVDRFVFVLRQDSVIASCIMRSWVLEEKGFREKNTITVRYRHETKNVCEDGTFTAPVRQDSQHK